MTISPPPVAGQEARVRELRTMKRRATGLLVLMTVVWAVVVAVTDGAGASGYVEAAAEASMVGALADWFAVTALFRHPLGIPIPHTAIIATQKDRFGLTLGRFVQENFLNADVIEARVRTAEVVRRASAWLEEPANAARLAGHVSDALVAVADVIRDEDVRSVLGDEVERAIRSLPVARLAGRALRTMTEQGRHEEVLDAALAGIERFLDENRDALRDRFAQESPWWLPNAAEDRIFERLLEGAKAVLHDATSGGEHRLRTRIDEWLADFAKRLETSPELAERASGVVDELLTNVELREWISSWWTDMKARLRTEASDPSSALRARVASALSAGGGRLREDPRLQAKAEELLSSGVRNLTGRFHEEIGDLVTGTIARWDPAETSRRLELLLGRDLQFIRINGTIVGGIAGLAIHTIARAVG